MHALFVLLLCGCVVAQLVEVVVLCRAFRAEWKVC
jgi:hypothetical protein